jgi:hypothetical protein
MIVYPTPQPYPSWKWVINETGRGYWDAPVALPLDDQKIYYWDEENLAWKVKE